MDNFSEEQIQDLLDSGFTNENIFFLQTLDLDYQDLYENIMNLLDQGYNPEQIIEEIERQQNEENEAYESGRTSIETLNGGKRKRKRKTRKGFYAHKSKKRKITRKSSRKWKNMRIRIR
jgi:hypothetical protein